MDAFDGSEGSGTIATEHLDEAPEWYERVPWDDDMKEVQVELPNFIARLLEHNNLPTSDDIRLCKEYQGKLQEPSLSVQNRIRLVVYQIDALQAELRNLEKEKTGYNKQSFACEVVCSPVRRLPLEIVQEIAIHLLLPRHHLLSGRDPIISTSQVCSGWRKAIASMPRLWARFGVDTTKITRSTYETAVKKAIVEYSDRSIPFPLDIEISLSDQELQSTRHERSHQLLSWLISDWSSIDRVRRLHIISFRFLEVLADEIRDPGTFSQLERLVLVSGRSTKPIRSNSVFDNNTNWGNLFLNAPNLRRISIDNQMGQFFQYLHFPFGQITHLFLFYSLSLGTWTSLLGQLSALESGFFCLSSERFTETTVHTPPLRHLAVMPESFEAYTNCIRLISKGRFPKLSHVEFMVPSSETLDPGNISLLSIPGVPLKHLSLFFMDSAPIEVLLAILRTSTDVTTLELGLPASQWAFLLKYLAFDESHTENQMLPIMDTLVIQASVPTDTLSWKGTSFENALCQEFVDMVRSRCTPSGTPSQTLHTIYFLPVQHPNYQLLVNDAQKVLSPYLQAGLSLRMRNLSESLEDNRFNSYMDADWNTLLPELPPSFVAPGNEGPFI